jgi:hypothetical protein
MIAYLVQNMLYTDLCSENRYVFIFKITLVIRLFDNGDSDTTCQLLWIEGCRVVSAADPLRPLISVF